MHKAMTKFWLRPGRLVFVLIASCLASCKLYNNPFDDSVTQKVMKKNGHDEVVVQAGRTYQANGLKRMMLGDHYRDVWLAPVEVPVIDMKEAKGGLNILEKGGGMQTYSLKLKANDGRLYSLRSIQKDPTPTLPYALKFSFADDIVQDQISASHPYGAFILPSLGDAAGIYHTNPELVYIPDSPELGKYREDFGGMLAMLEEDADEDWSGYEDFGGTENAVSTETVREELRDDNDNRVDQENFLRARLFDMWIGDWDRHGGQFRWAEFEDDTGKYYRPIPEDRDNIFFKFDGFVPWWASRKWALRKFQDFQPEVRDIAGLNFNARYIDRRFLTDLSKEQWVEMARDLQERLTDEVIENAIQALPDTVFELSGRELINTLKARRNNLERFALDYYLVLAEEVNVVGSNKEEYFEVIRKENGNTEVNVYEASDDGEKERQFYNRVFYPDETDEVRLYGLGGEDFFYVSGEGKDGILVRIIGGDGEDTFADSSKVRGMGDKTIYYDDNDKENKIEDGTETKLVIDDDPETNQYDFEDFKYGYLGPTGYFGANSDDGIFFGGGVIIKTQGFRKDPYASKHRIVANFAPKTGAWNFEYNADFIRVVGDLGFNMDLLLRAPNFFTNFYGFGNETERAVDNNDDFYDVRYEELLFYPGLQLNMKNTTVKFGPAYQYAKVKKGGDRFIDLVAPSLDPGLFASNHFLGFEFDADVRTTEIESKPEKGIRWITELKWMNELNHDNSKFSKIRSDFSVYYTVDIPMETTFAVRIGGESISGDFNFYQAATIGGNAGLNRLGNVRGYGRDRFAGRSSIYQNNEIRMRLAKIPFYYLPFEFGISGHFDHGRVWADGEDSDKWHSGVGGGVWIAPLGRWVFTAVYTKSDEDSIYNLNLGFLF
ncbi:hypothetical protein E1163_21445 [Fulvivirga kasyanovii]|uniref:Bacterial surface antigen (D15) domain-containing protein n=2 Tax=Fulvivirga kasyanovii TaxID=396812 RepID=A0ABW9RUZ2_9BACT|nr:hypothetical protein [Fulvivirga kasyanovii]